ncbi:DUF3459 domain-containing protein [Halobacillus trueperi]|uniref:DUF3459 domain-containing protein n=1 Tax=Halobacillus trueperi TaxID=156205 RepID=UPI001FC9D9F0|nr:alpha-glucosidase C-terminal domain-containing protein [Halobacillus trueperi]
MIWEEEKQNQDILSHYKTLIDARNDQPALTQGDFNVIYSDDDVLVFERSVPQDKVLVVMNLGEEDRKLDIIDLYNQQTPNKVQLTSLLEKEKLKSHKGTLEMTSEAVSVAIYDVKGKLRYEAPTEEKKYNKVVLRGSAPFDWSSDANMLTFDEKEARWKSEPMELTAGETVEYKFVRDGEWLEGDNLRFTPEADGEYIFIFDPQNEYQVTVEQVQVKNEAA